MKYKLVKWQKDYIEELLASYRKYPEFYYGDEKVCMLVEYLKYEIQKFIDEELPEDEICEVCERYDVNGVEIKNKLLKILEKFKHGREV